MQRTEKMLRWLWTGRLIVATALFVAALASWFRLPDGQAATLIATTTFIAALGVTAGGIWWVHIRGRIAGPNLLYGQLLFDVLLVTIAVHLTGGPSSPFPPLYILVITAAALLLPLPGGLLIGALSSLLFLADVAFHPAVEATSAESLRAVLFIGIAVVTAAVGHRLRQAGTALGEAESEIRQLRLDLGEILATIDTGLITLDGEGRLLHINAAAEALLGDGLGNFMGRPVLGELERAAPGLGALVERAVGSRSPATAFEVRTNGRGDRYLGVRATRAGSTASPRITAVLQDMTERRQVEQLTRRADRLQAVADLGASLAHEIRNPLASISSAVEQLAGERLDPTDREVLRRLVVSESERLSRLLSDFMEFSRLEMRRWSAVDLHSVTAAAIDLAGTHPDRSAAVSIDYRRPAGTVRVHGDRDLLLRAIFNLVLNAVQHSGAAGAVTVELDQPQDGVPPGIPVSQPIRLSVLDTGPGVSEADAGRLFDPFYSTRTGGTGLGLAMVHRAIEAHGGTILVDNPDSGGARFTVYLPAFAESEFEHAQQAG